MGLSRPLDNSRDSQSSILLLIHLSGSNIVKAK
jgi:hypothetical protein